jgi:hypothetical protein
LRQRDDHLVGAVQTIFDSRALSRSRHRDLDRHDVAQNGLVCLLLRELPPPLPALVAILSSK